MILTMGHNVLGSVAVFVSAAVLAGCSSGSGDRVSTSPGVPGGAAARCDLNNPKAGATGPAASHALHNVHHIGSKVISGAVPESEAAFDELRSMGVRTIISVDGASPDVERAAARGIRYVHIPITYAEATREQQLELARAVRDLPGPIYVHCHHGKHRSPAAAAAIAVTLGEVTPEEGVAFMKAAGTAPNYTGLYACVAHAVVASVAALDGAPADFPAVCKPEGITGAMVQIDEAFEHLGQIRAAGWTTPADHPDLVPAAEAGRLADQLRFGGEDVRAQRLGDEFRRRLAESIGAATALEDGLTSHASAEQLERRWKLVAVSCKECHAAYRDVKR